MPEANNTEKKTKDGVALVVGGLFILALVFAAYNYFNNAGPANTSGTENRSIIDRVRDVFTPEENQQDDLNGDGAMDKNSETELDNSGTLSDENIQTEWVANDYNQGDINTKSYTVVRGDTLWEIAEAVYGNGADWTRILEANSSDVGFLTNGQQALIVPGQVLVIP